ncbi:hypothetical protein Ddye_025544 [Dipteronia dyeriana]|uniref:Uncharacterized protein n=1 Tax=Dipteronia dyeriana TaxID=168575 RepID=A0AAD9TKE5_9ROSI|nr:hypothetical protein Ddye_025544 [Dipteronia dyeriana]
MVFGVVDGKGFAAEAFQAECWWPNISKTIEETQTSAELKLNMNLHKNRRKHDRSLKTHGDSALPNKSCWGDRRREIDNIEETVSEEIDVVVETVEEKIGAVEGIANVEKGRDMRDR